MPFQLIPSLNAGELSPRLESRPDLEKYGTGCRTLENFIIMPYGGVNRRPGLEYMGAAKHPDKAARIIGFNFSASTNFIIEFGNLYIRFWSNGEQVESAPGVPLDVTSPYLEAHLFELQYAQINDVVYITHPSYAVRKLSRVADDNWTLEAVAWDYPALKAQNITTTTLAASAVTGTGITITASADTFLAANVGGYYEITHRRDTSFKRLALTATATGTAMRVIGAWDFRTYGTWSGTVEIQRSYDNVTWETTHSHQAAADRNISTAGEEEKDSWLRLKHTFTSCIDTPYAYLEAAEATVYGVVKITGFTSATVVTADVIKDLHSATATSLWAEGAWSDRRGHPRTVALHEQRLWFGGNTDQPQTVWGSAINDFGIFRNLTYDDASVAFTIASNETNAINWMVSQSALCVGTAGYEYIVSASSADSAITPSNVQVKAQTHYGSKYARAILANEVVLFVQRQGRKIREFVYQFEKDGYVSPDLTLLADHITEGGITQIAFQQQPDAIVWCGTGDGILAGLTYERGQNVVGWHRHTTAGTFESVASIYGDDGSDEVWCAVKRTIQGEEVRHIERFVPEFRQLLEDQDKVHWNYLDASTTYEGPAATVIAGLDHLEGESVDILADGAVVPAQTVSGGQITLTTAASVVTVGLGYTSTIKPMPLDPGPLPDGSAQGRHFRVARMVVRIYKSLGGEVEVEDGVWDPLPCRDTSDPMDASPPPFTGDREVMLARGYERKATIQVRQTQPLPLTILALIPIYDIIGS